MGEMRSGLLFVQNFIRSRGMEHKHTQHDMSSIFRWAISTGWEEAPRPAAPMVSTRTFSWIEPAHTLPAHRTHNSLIVLLIVGKNGRKSSLRLILFHLLNICELLNIPVVSFFLTN